MHVAGRDGEIVQEAERNDGRVPLCTFLRRRAGIEDRYASGQGLTTADPRAKPVDGFVVLLGQVPRSLNRPVIGTPLDITRPSDLAAPLNIVRCPNATPGQE